jgi:hypothetical protein
VRAASAQGVYEALWSHRFCNGGYICCQVSLNVRDSTRVLCPNIPRCIDDESIWKAKCAELLPESLRGLGYSKSAQLVVLDNFPKLLRISVIPDHSQDNYLGMSALKSLQRLQFRQTRPTPDRP